MSMAVVCDYRSILLFYDVIVEVGDPKSLMRHSA